MNQEQSIALWRQGKEAWNAWANAMLQRQEGLKRSGLWKTTPAYPFELEQGDSDEAKNWFDEARVDFKGVIFDPPDAKLQINFEGFIFPGAVSFAHASFRGNSWFWHAEFRHIALFEQAEFSGIASFAGAVFHNIASFCGALFNEGTFTRVRFLRRSEFTITRFAGQVDNSAETPGSMVPSFRALRSSMTPNFWVQPILMRERSSKPTPDFFKSALADTHPFTRRTLNARLISLPLEWNAL